MIKRGNASPIFFLSLLLPAIAFGISLRYIWDKQYHKIILFFSFWLGYTVFFFGGDLLEYKNAFDITAKYDWSDFFYLLRNTFSDDKFILFPDNVVNSKPDTYALTLQFIITRFTENERWFFAFVTLIYTYLILKFKDEVLLFSGVQSNKIWRFFFASLLLIVPFYVGVTGVRFWTALFWFMLFAMKYLRTKRFYYILLSSVSITIHYTFMFPVGILLIYRSLNISRAVMRVLVVVSLAFYVLSTTAGLLGFANDAIELFGDSSVKTVSTSYTDEEIIEAKNTETETANWYVKVRQALITYSFFSIFLLEFAGVFRWRTNKYLDSWYSLYVLFFSISALTINLGSLGRFSYIFYLLSLVRLLVLCAHNPKNKYLHTIRFYMYPVMLIHVLVSLRAGFYYVDPLLLVGNPVVFFLVNSKISLSEFIVGH